METCPLAPHLGPLQERVGTLENRVGNVETKVDALKLQSDAVQADTAAIRAAVVGVTRLGTFAKKHGRFVVGIIVGSLYASGFLSPASFHRLKTAIAYVATEPQISLENKQ